MDYELMFPGRFVKSVEFHGKTVTKTIARVYTEELEGQKGKKTKGIVVFSDAKKEWVLNRTNAECLKGLFGRDTDKWVGKRVTLYPAPYVDPFTGVAGTAIRVYGSPEISAPLNLTFKVGQKMANVTLHPTGPKAANGNGARKSATPPPAHDPTVASPETVPEPPPEAFEPPPPTDEDRPF
jgi:hypothetical protein